MSEYIIVDGDEVNFEKMFGLNNVSPTGARKMQGSGEATIDNKKICILGDEKKLVVSATYTKPPFTQPGKGTITITSLGADQTAPFATAQRPVIVKGSQCLALFTPETPAMNPATQPPTPDVPTPAPGSGTFNHSQTFVTTG